MLMDHGVHKMCLFHHFIRKLEGCFFLFNFFPCFGGKVRVLACIYLEDVSYGFFLRIKNKKLVLCLVFCFE